MIRPIQTSLIVTLLGVGFIFGVIHQANALSGSSFNAGRIIEDDIFYDPDTMTPGEIRNFMLDLLDDRDQTPDGINGSCDSDGSEPSPYGNSTRAEWAASWSNGNTTPFVCLPYYWENPTTKVNNYYSYNSTTKKFINIYDGTVPDGAISSARIIYNVAQEFGVNPRVLIVLLQKETGRITDDWPLGFNYRTATGYGCPDTSPCNSAFFGFYNQVYRAARQFTLYRDNPDNFGYVAGQRNKIYWSPNHDCGYSWVFIENQATAGLYNYTPYRPNTAALNNLYGSGDSCSSYGNRNFWRYFNDWFGIDAKIIKKSENFNQPLMQGERRFVWVEYKNSGVLTWYEKGYETDTKPLLELVTAGPTFRSSVFGETWNDAQTIPSDVFYQVYHRGTLSENQHRVLPGEHVRMGFSITVPYAQATGEYIEKFRLKLDGTNIPNSLVDMPFKVTGRKDSAKFIRASTALDTFLAPSERRFAWIEYQNTGDGTWYDDYAVSGGPGVTAFAPGGMLGIKLVTAALDMHSSDFGSFWGDNQNILNITFARVFEKDGKTSAENQHRVRPEQIVRIGFLIGVPGNQASGIYQEYIRLKLGSQLVENSLWKMRLRVVAPSTEARLVGVVPEKTIPQGERRYYWVKYQNTGNTTWYDTDSVSVLAPDNVAGVQLVTTKPVLRASDFGALWGVGKNITDSEFTKVYEEDGDTLSSNQNLVLPGQIVLLDTTVSVPGDQVLGNYTEYMRLKYDSGDIIDPYISWKIIVQ